jgi:succinoglycan biosynthesis protein ExoL
MLNAICMRTTGEVGNVPMKWAVRSLNFSRRRRRHDLPPRLQARSRRDRVEAPERALPLGTVARCASSLCDQGLEIGERVMKARIAYFAHDLSDPSVHRRVRMLICGGSIVIPIGFRRTPEAPTAVEGVGAVDLGRTGDGMLTRRALSVAGALIKLEGIAEHIRGCDVILARNLEMLVLAVRARELYAPRATVVYECLDIHRLLLAKGPSRQILRFLESKLWRGVDLLLTSSPAFVDNYFMHRGFPAPIRLVENKVLMLGQEEARTISLSPPPGPPWRIGWFGMIRCRKSLDILSSIARENAGALEVVIRGRPSGATFPDFEAATANLPHVRYYGPYRNPGDLPEIYGGVHFSWAIDYYESGQNSAWLLPCRMYEGSFFGAVPIALAGVETGRWLAKRGAGVLLDEPIERQLTDFFGRLDRDKFKTLANRVGALPRKDLVSDRSDCRELVETLCRSSAGAARHSEDVSAQSKTKGLGA